MKVAKCGRTLIIGVSGATWDRLAPLKEEGRVPNIARTSGTRNRRHFDLG